MWIYPACREYTRLPGMCLLSGVGAGHACAQKRMEISFSNGAKCQDLARTSVYLVLIKGGLSLLFTCFSPSGCWSQRWYEVHIRENRTRLANHTLHKCLDIPRLSYSLRNVSPLHFLLCVGHRTSSDPDDPSHEYLIRCTSSPVTVPRRLDWYGMHKACLYLIPT